MIDSLNPMLDLSLHRTDFGIRLQSAKNLVVAGEVSVGTTGDISRETRGLAIVLVFAAYENLLKKIVTSVLEQVAGSKAGNGRLKPGFKVVAASSKIQGLLNSNRKHLWTGKGQELMELATSGRHLSIQTTVFPSDGSFMKRSQISTVCDLFHLGDPSVPLYGIWDDINGIVRYRNAIAHGEQRADEVGRNYSYQETLDLIDDWSRCWNAFIDWIEIQCTTSAYFLLPR
ncbi:HEPN domain-containing protein [Paenarthrobacter sp. CC6]|uniref:HEPN domain-containing protein n=1 Tax=Paenarthrobacter sp. CC6 TaxID=3029184 RepID=UPI00339BE671